LKKIFIAKWTGGVAKQVECLLCKFEALIQILVPPKKKKSEKKDENLSSYTRKVQLMGISFPLPSFLHF
jgi:hypothetical protein